ncbi:hypothetical protein TWF594_009791 [Orbilia oligospora]|nr:hypothetical protein TWF594_009791 [Orbilia oligospora]
MDNSFFRNLVNNTPRVDRSSTSTNATSTSSAAPSLGSRQRSSIPMTPRSVGGATSFAQQAAAYRLQQNPPKEKKFKSSVPLGSKLPQGYVDRTKFRDDDDTTTTDAEQRMAALMQLVEEGSLTREEAIEQSRAFGGDAKSTHLVKGLDFKLLERARKGEDVLAEKKDDEELQDEEDIEDELDQALEKKVESVKRQRKEEKDDDDDEPKKKTRAEILAEWKKSREEAAAKKVAESSLGSKFKKFGEKEKKKPKAKKEEKPIKASKDSTSGKKRKRDHEEPSKEKVLGNGTVLGMLPPDLPSTKAVPAENQDEDGDVNIFDDAPDDYDPLAGLADSDDDSGSDEGEVEDKTTKKNKTQEGMPPPPPPPPPPSTRPRNYFATSSKDADVSTQSISSTPLSGQDLTNTIELSAAIKKAAQMRELSKADLDDEEAKKAARHKAMLQAASRDDEDVDMSFGGSRTFGDDDDDDLGVTKKKKRGKKNT